MLFVISMNFCPVCVGKCTPWRHRRRSGWLHRHFFRGGDVEQTFQEKKYWQGSQKKQSLGKVVDAILGVPAAVLQVLVYRLQGSFCYTFKLRTLQRKRESIIFLRQALTGIPSGSNCYQTCRGISQARKVRSDWLAVYRRIAHRKGSLRLYPGDDRRAGLFRFSCQVSFL